jgi:membrane fusion protein, copper/silver efflux system
LSRFPLFFVSTLFVSALFISALLGACASEPPPLPPQLSHYVKAQEALANDDYEAARLALDALTKTSHNALQKHAGQAAQAGDITAMRLEFLQVSEIMTQEKAPAGYALAYCPMVEEDRGGYWIQRQGKIMNPYFGASMLHCGSIRPQRADATP